LVVQWTAEVYIIITLKVRKAVLFPWSHPLYWCQSN